MRGRQTKFLRLRRHDTPGAGRFRWLRHSQQLSAGLAVRHFTRFLLWRAMGAAVFRRAYGQPGSWGWYSVAPGCGKCMVLAGKIVEFVLVPRWFGGRDVR